MPQEQEVFHIHIIILTLTAREKKKNISNFLHGLFQEIYI